MHRRHRHAKKPQMLDGMRRHPHANACNLQVRQEELERLRAAPHGDEEDAEDAAGPRRTGPKSHVLTGFGAVPRYLKEEGDVKSESSDHEGKGDDGADGGCGRFAQPCLRLGAGLGLAAGGRSFRTQCILFMPAHAYMSW